MADTRAASRKPSLAESATAAICATVSPGSTASSAVLRVASFFLCKAQYFRPNCYQKRVLAYGEWVDANVLVPVSHR